ncbi:16S rRNA (uracil(1498)-N(3))-methyltransferase [Sporosarcina sp. P37]|uniref:16S rRNA (uracil(1498)-N(3))-methyltransferase n=1 Tax=unclassified Sporosarcina TaxID=2647733 RepID=UPI0009BF0BFD|nr:MULTISPECIES: 16S rRNA (uracil(1498)-N(3))-methyltransferase [unclassified Sporosarcina]ARD49785.1 16S rRNA (uracil(1498)-N(3))-methyltransferase [Sporosarcina sp. P33]ARK26367.1 16S rRNA (uracil(1498)-N(3))-methyltransferase [Sporosarcina sp. P37]PID19662.1 16S rRNA (uracil(1498)-N(3))-methyltransferase [Sporosarcina sp. P35]
MQRYFLDQPFDEQQQVAISGDDYKHIVKVMRMTPGQEVLTVYEGIVSAAVIDSISEEHVTVSQLRVIDQDNELPVSVTIACGLPKGDKLDWITQKGTELGMSRLIPFAASRSIVKWDAKKGGKRIERLQKIAKEAAEQCHRNKVPEISSVQSVKQLIASTASFDIKLFADEEDAKSDVPHKIADRLKNVHPGQTIAVVFGPEGGLAREEAALLQEAGFLPASLGPRILRTETAPLYVLSAMSYEFE